MLGDVPLDVRRQQAALPSIDRTSAQNAATWTAFLTGHWRRAMAQEREDDPVASIGARLVNIVVNHHRRIIALRRRALQSDVGYLNRVRDPLLPESAPAGVRGRCG